MAANAANDCGRSPESTPRSTSIARRRIAVGFFVAGAASALPHAARSSRPASAVSTRGRDDVLEERVLDHSLAIELDHRFVRAGGLPDGVAVDGVGQLEQSVVAASWPRAARFRTARGARRASGVEDVPGDGRVLPEPGDGGQKCEPRPSRCDFFFQFEVAAVGGAASFVEHVGVEAIVGAVAIDHVFVGGAEQLVAAVVVSRDLRSRILFASLRRRSARRWICRSGRLPAEIERRHLPIGLGVGFQEGEELGDQRPLVVAGRALLVFDRPQPAEGERMERGVAVFERRVFDLADPLQHEGHRGDAVAAIEQRFDDQLKCLRRIELVDEHSPEFDVARGGARFVPGAEGPGDEIRRDFDFLCHESFDAADAGRGVFVPPAGESIEGGRKNRARARRRRARPLRSRRGRRDRESARRARSNRRRGNRGPCFRSRGTG